MSADPEPLRLTDLVHAVGGWPSDPAAVARVLDGADALLPEGRETYRPLSTEEVAALVLVAGGLDAEPAMALVDLARANDETGFHAFAGMVGLSREASTTLWAQTRRRLGVPVTARVR
jgi:hypothetical protein